MFKFLSQQSDKMKSRCDSCPEMTIGSKKKLSVKKLRFWHKKAKDLDKEEGYNSDGDEKKFKLQYKDDKFMFFPRDLSK